MIGIGVIGYGYWGPNLVRNFAEVPGSWVVAVSDLRPEDLLRCRLVILRSKQLRIMVTCSGSVR